MFFYIEINVTITFKDVFSKNRKSFSAIYKLRRNYQNVLTNEL